MRISGREASIKRVPAEHRTDNKTATHGYGRLHDVGAPLALQVTGVMEASSIPEAQGWIVTLNARAQAVEARCNTDHWSRLLRPWVKMELRSLPASSWSIFQGNKHHKSKRLTCKSGSNVSVSELVVLSIDASSDGVKVIRVALASAKAGASSSGSACAPGVGRNKGTPAKSGQNTSATKSTKHEGVRLQFSNESLRSRTHVRRIIPKRLVRPLPLICVRGTW